MNSYSLRYYAAHCEFRPLLLAFNDINPNRPFLPPWISRVVSHISHEPCTFLWNTQFLLGDTHHVRKYSTKDHQEIMYCGYGV